MEFLPNDAKNILPTATLKLGIIEGVGGVQGH